MQDEANRNIGTARSQGRMLLGVIGLSGLALGLWLGGADARAQTTLTFEEFGPNTSVSEIYAPQGVHFMNDFRPGNLYFSAPVIIAHPTQPGAGNVLLNGAQDCEIGSSFNAPLVFWFDQRKASVSMVLGTIPFPGGAPCGCGGLHPATVSFRDCNGTLLGQINTNISVSFNTTVQFSDAQRRIKRVDVDYGATPCNEAIDNLSFTAGTGNCTDTTTPVITITSHTNDQLVVESQQFLSGRVSEPGILRSVLLNGFPTSFRLFSDGSYFWDGSVFLQEGNNTVTVIAENASGLRGSAQVRLFLGTPVSATLNSFHLTQRGVMQDVPCDIDTPLVAGKTTIARLSLDIRTANGTPTYASSVRLNVFRKRALLPDLLVKTFFGNTYSAFASSLNSASDLAAVHFWMPGYERAFDTADEYRFTVEAFVGNNRIGPALNVCGGQYVQFTETKPVRLLILPVERGRMDGIFNGTPHLQNFYQQLDTVARAYPVRDGVGIANTLNRGLIFYELPPLSLCDGPLTAGYSHCDGTDWTWDFIEKHPSGLLRRGNDEVVSDPMMPGLCDPSNPIIGGRIINTTTPTFSYNPSLGMYRIEPIPQWPRGKHVTPQDEDHDGDVDGADIAFYAAEFFDNQTGQWSTDFSRYDHGEVFRYFRDLNGNSCYDAGEPQAPVRQRGINERTLLWDPAQKALDEMNGYIPGTANDFRSASLWYPDPIIPTVQFGASGPGQGQRAGKLSWIRVMNIVAMAHELGHNFDLPDLYGDSIPDDLRSIENAWAVYINGVSKRPEQTFEIMAVSQSPDTELFSKAHYQKIFDQLKINTTAAAAPEPASSLAAAPTQFVISGIFYDDDRHIDKLMTARMSGLDPTPAAPGSPYSLVFGVDTRTIRTLRFAMDPRPDGHSGGQLDEIGYQTFRVVTDFPANAQWVEIRQTTQTLARVERSAAAPTVRIVTPNGGESYSATQAVDVVWQAADADSSTLHSTVFFSPDGGTNWQLLAVGLRGSHYPWNTVNSPGTSNGLIRVVVCDGFNTSEDRSDRAFAVAGKAPRAVILEPREGQTFLQCSRIIIRGVADDPEDRLNSVVWAVDGVRATARLEAQLEPLAPGRHTLRLTAFDADNLSGFDEVTINVVADSDCDGMSDQFETEHGLNPGLVNDARNDDDKDGLSNFDEAGYGTNPQRDDTDGDLFPDGLEVAVNSNPTKRDITPFTSGFFTNALYINCGGPGVLDTLGRLWRPDHPFLVASNSNVASFVGRVDTTLLADTNVPQAVLLSERWRDGHINYRIPAPRGTYSVVLYFAENCTACVNPNLGGTGPAGAARVFDLQVEGIRTNAYNQADAAVSPANDGRGATFKATQVAFRDVRVIDGALNIDILDRGTGNPPENAAIKGMAIIQQGNGDGLTSPEILSIQRFGNTIRVRVELGPNRAAFHAGLTEFDLESSTNLRTWASTGRSPVNVANGVVTFETPRSGPARFYRVHARAVNRQGEFLGSRLGVRRWQRDSVSP